MSTRQKFVIPGLMLGLLVGMAAVTIAVAQGPQSATVQVTQNASVVSLVRAGDYVTVSGTGYRPDAQLQVCRDGDGCTHPTADSSGTFSRELRFYSLGNRAVKVYEVNKSWSNARLKAVTYLNVTD